MNDVHQAIVQRIADEGRLKAAGGTAEKVSGGPIVVSEAARSRECATEVDETWIDTAEQRAALAESVHLPISEFSQLLRLARVGLRQLEMRDLLHRAVNGPWSNQNLVRARELLMGGP